VKPGLFYAFLGTAPANLERSEAALREQLERVQRQGNLERAMAPYGVSPDRIPVAFNVFMHVDVNSKTGEIRVLPPLSRPGDSTGFRAEMDLIVALTACSAGQSNNFRYKPIHYRVE
jgi:hypothetical protein